MAVAEYFYVMEALPGCWSSYWEPDIIPVSVEFLHKRKMGPRELTGTAVKELDGSFVGLLGVPIQDTLHGKWLFPVVRPGKCTETG